MPARVCFLLAHVGDHHAPRLCDLQNALRAQGGELLVIQGRRSSVFYRHKQSRRDALTATLSITLLGQRAPSGQVADVWRRLSHERPTHVVVLGYSDPLALTAMLWAKAHRRPVVFLSDSKADDQPRSRGGELIKSLLLKGFDGALVAGLRHKAYFRSLGFQGPIGIGYDVVDNSYHEARARAYGRRRSKLVAMGAMPERFVLCVSRLIPRKRVDRAVEIFAASGISGHGFEMIIVGNGPHQGIVEDAIERLGVRDKVKIIPHLPTSRMPLLYSGARALILASEYDQWGLCVNEAMACGVPTVVSERSGAAHELVVDGDNGIVFADNEIAKAIDGLQLLCRDAKFHATMAHSAKRTMASWSLDTFTRNLLEILDDVSRAPRNSSQ